MIDSHPGGFGSRWWHLSATRFAVGLCLDLAGLASAVAADNPDDFFSFGAVTALVGFSGFFGFLYAYRLEHRSVELRPWQGVVVWVTSAPEAIIVVPLLLSTPVVAVTEPGPILGNLLFLAIAGASASLTVVVQAAVTRRWWKVRSLGRSV